MNRNIEEAKIGWGLPEAYVRRDIRQFIPEGQRSGAGT